MGTNNPHDSFFRSVFSRPELAAEQFRELLPKRLVDSLDLDTLKHIPGRFVDEALAENASDVLFEVQLSGRPALVYVLYEHQSTVDGLMPVRLLIYMSRAWAQYLRDHPDVDKIPAIVPVVLYQGPDAWTASTRFLDLVDLPADLLEDMRGHLPDFRFVLDDLSLQADQEIRARTRHPLAALALLLLKHARDQRDAFLAALREAADLLRQVQDKGDLLLTSSYILVVGQVTVREIEATLGEAVTPQVREAVMTAAEQLIEQGEERGRIMERRDMLQVLLETRFGELEPAVAQRLQKATGEELTGWLTRFANANTLEEVFGKE